MAEEGQPRGPPSALTTRGETPVPVTPVQQLLYLPGLVSSSFSPFTVPSPESYLHADAILTQNRVCIYLQQTHPETRTKREEQGPKRLPLQPTIGPWARRSLRGPHLSKGAIRIHARTSYGADERGHMQTGAYITATCTAPPGRAEAVGTHGVEGHVPPPSLPHHVPSPLW